MQLNISLTVTLLLSFMQLSKFIPNQIKIVSTFFHGSTTLIDHKLRLISPFHCSGTTSELVTIYLLTYSKQVQLNISFTVTLLQSFMQLSKFIPNQIKIGWCLSAAACWLSFAVEINFYFRLRIKENSSQSFPCIPTLWWVACVGFRSEEQD